MDTVDRPHLDFLSKRGERLLDVKTDKRPGSGAANIAIRVQARRRSNGNNAWSQYFIHGQRPWSWQVNAYTLVADDC